MGYNDYVRTRRRPLRIMPAEKLAEFTPYTPTLIYQISHEVPYTVHCSIYTTKEVYTPLRRYTCIHH